MKVPGLQSSTKLSEKSTKLKKNRQQNSRRIDIRRAGFHLQQAAGTDDKTPGNFGFSTPSNGVLI